MAVTAEGISRNEIVDRLTATLRRSSITTDRDRQRAEAVARELDELGVLAPRSLVRDVAGIFRHPVVAGATLAVISGILASLVIPALTRVWQDRPRELTLKRSLVEEISESVTQTVITARYSARDLVNVNRHRRGALSRRALTRTSETWRISSGNVSAELTTYFRGSVLPTTWRRYESVVNDYLVYAFNVGLAPRYGDSASAESKARLRRQKIAKHFDDLHFRAPNAEKEKKTWLGTIGVDAFVDISEISELLLLERDQLTSDVVDGRAAGFSHGFWLFK